MICRARRAERAQQAELARALGDGDREGVEDDERADDQRYVGEDQQEGAQEAELFFEFGGLVGGFLCAGAHRQRRGQRGADARGELRRGETPGLVATLMLSYAPGSPATYWACWGISSATLAPPNDSLPANFAIPEIV